MAQMEKRKQAVASKLGVKKNSGVVKKSKAAANKAATLAGKASEADEFTFIWDDDRLQPQQTPEGLNWEDDEVVDIMW